MQVVQQVKTFDGKVHEDYDAAVRHLNKLHADLLSKISHEIVKQEKYTKVGDWIDTHLGLFLDLHAIKQDMQVQPPEED